MQTGGIFSEGKKTLAEQAYESIREAILTLRLKPGQLIYESELASSLNMSRTPIREAMRFLLVEELIEVLPQRGMKVALISENKVEDTRYVREILEVGSLRRVVENWDSGQVKYQHLQRDLEANLELQKRTLREEGDYAQFLRADERFHRLFLQSTGNTTLISIVTQMRSHLNRVRALTLQELQNINALIEEHEQLVAAIIAKDEARAVAVLTAHLRRLSMDLRVVKQQYSSFFAQD